MPRSAKTAAASSGSTPTKSKHKTEVPVATTEAPESATVPIPMVTDAEQYGYPAYEYPGYNTDPDFDFPEELQDWGEEEVDLEPPLDWGLPDDDDDTGQEEAPDEAGADIPATHQVAAAGVADEKTHLLLDYFAAHALNGLLAALPASPDISFDAAQTAHLAYECAEAMLRERHKRLGPRP